MKIKDVTESVKFTKMYAGITEEVCIDITQCVCGHNFDSWMTATKDSPLPIILSAYNDDSEPEECPECHRRFLFIPCAVILEVED